MSDSMGGSRQHVKLAIAIVALLAAVVLGWKLFPRGPDTDIAGIRPFKCAECGATFPHELQYGESDPIKCPKCGKTSAWLPEACNWMKGPNGEYVAKTKPTWVILNQRMGIEGKTFCPDCGHEVTGHNRMPSKEEMDAAKAAGR